MRHVSAAAIFAATTLSGCQKAPAKASEPPRETKGAVSGKEYFDRYECQLSEAPDGADLSQLRQFVNLPNVPRHAFLVVPSMELKSKIASTHEGPAEYPQESSKYYSLFINPSILQGDLPSTPEVVEDRGRPVEVGLVHLRWYDDRDRKYEFELRWADVGGSERATYRRYSSAKSTEPELHLEGHCWQVNYEAPRSSEEKVSVQ